MSETDPTETAIIAYLRTRSSHEGELAATAQRAGDSGGEDHFKLRALVLAQAADEIARGAWRIFLNEESSEVK